MNEKEALTNLAKYLYFLMEDGVQEDNFSERICTDINKLLKVENMEAIQKQNED